MARKTSAADDFGAAREKILSAALTHVPFDGWTIAALTAGAVDAGYDTAMARRAFPDGPVQAIEYHSALADRRMLEALEKCKLSELKVRERIATAVGVRLEQNAVHREAIRRALAHLALPQNAGMSLRCLYRTVDAIWHAAGDTSTDFNFYTKRGLLAGVYSATLLHWLNDDSEDFVATRGFLDRRIADVMRVPRFLGQFQRITEAFPSPFRVFRRPTAGAS